MPAINENIRFIRKQLKLTQEQFGQQLGIKRSLVGAYEEGRAEPRLELLHKMAMLAGVQVDALISTDMNGPAAVGLKPKDFSRSREVLVVSVDSHQRENIELVPQKAAAGYLNGYADPDYVKELPRFNLPNLNTGTYRAFEISGDSMLPILPGTIIVGEYVENLKDIKNGKTYVLVTNREGVVYKRVFNYLDENGKLFLVSDNRQYSPFQIDGEDVLEAWSAKAYISVQFPDMEPQKEMSIENLAGVVLDLQKEILDLKSKKK
ncbi:MAG TPA: LexA family transcriptional regulator [Cyclobacteriaceae bacterium]|nr:LexA family transcriptional regulator [Cyclobacteriaceae bacterium]MCB9236792.1 LexA family transcriptional regulator [Flammeovirgaceae bacterium]MCB0498641.1 LexA family transcriptional regulator [Cyclobacteriaceae bacterium]MCO5272323.1 LexA family transcriptional regulator [Cyclobacteriaceae bacterium]MCW5902071.1 LexA family transcriptional regulator [Cyclobacteriaceae bacterium]